MNKSELVDSVAKKANLSNKEAAAAVKAFMETVKDSLVANESVIIVGFGTFLVRERAARKGHNPRTGEELAIAACKIPSFRPGKAMKDLVNGRKEA